jgi:hypothetical protein
VLKGLGLAQVYVGHQQGLLGGQVEGAIAQQMQLSLTYRENLC